MTTTSVPAAGSDRRVARAAIWLPGLAVAIGAAVATAHGLYEVAVAARVPAAIAWLYPLITDGLALVAYAAIARLTGSAQRYAWAVVVAAAGLSGLAQAAFLASEPATPATPVEPGAEPASIAFVASAPLRFGVGAWPAIAAAVVAHLLYLLAVDHAPAPESGPGSTGEPGQPPAVAQENNGMPATRAERSAEVGRSVVQPAPVATSYTPAQSSVGHRGRLSVSGVERPSLPARDHGFSRPTSAASVPSARSGERPARDRARAAAERHAQRHHALPTVTQLMALAEVSRGTAGEVLKAMRAQPTPLHLVAEPATDTPERRTQP
jgi:hypothetical protein